MSAKPVAILLAAGQSLRFGNDKLLAQLTIGQTKQSLIEHTLQRWFTVFEEISIVVSPDNLPLQRQLNLFAESHPNPLRMVTCPDSRLGMANSLRAGVVAHAEATGWMIGLADMPLIPVAVLQQVQQALIQGAHIAAPFVDGQRGHPVGFNRRYRNALLALEGDSGAKSLLKSEAESIYKIETDLRGILIDVDSVDDVRKIEEEVAISPV